MGRSVSYPLDSEAVCFRDVTWIEDGFEWDEFIDDIRYQAKAKWKSFDDCDEWIGREDRAILENDHAYIGVSEYCGLAAIWLKSKADDLEGSWYPEDASQAPLARAWSEQIADNFNKMFGEYVKVGCASNGECFYEKVA